ncbi:MAG TPA: response regulator [Rhodopirellula baltica]|uniref:Probable two-component system response regulator n=2 Tax=Rhodopirellula baltica TaxID=265606 RepID=Q7URS8_RHOBA|nr:probable two-component system response regulator [Rhodopirellula baltica SH 1]HBE61230.1 response regulator [Rhodopirellula baltica]
MGQLMEDSTVLVVEDDEAIRFGVELRLRAMGYLVHSANDGKDAIRKAETLLPSLICMDVRMPLLDGITALHWMKSHPQLKGTPVIIASARPTDERVAMSAGARYFLLKPYGAEVFEAAVTQVLRPSLHFNRYRACGL